MAETTTIRLPPKLRARIHSLAKQSWPLGDSFILEAVERHADYEEQMRSLVNEAIEADAEMDPNRRGVSRGGRARVGGATGPRHGHQTDQSLGDGSLLSTLAGTRRACA